MLPTHSVMINRKAPVIQNVPEQSGPVCPLGISTSPPEVRSDPMKRRKKRWKMPTWALLAISAALCVTAVQSHITSDGVNQVEFLTSDSYSGTFHHLDDNDHLPSNVGDVDVDSSSDVLRDDVSKSTHFNGSRSSRLLKSLQTTFERHFKETLLCDHNDIIFNSSSGSIVVQTVNLDGCKNLSSLSDVFDVASFDASKYRNGVRNVTVTRASRLTRLDVAGFRSLRQLVLRQNGIVAFELLQSVSPNLEFLDLSENPLTQFVASDVSSVAPNLKTLLLANCSNLERVEFTNSDFLDEKLAPGLLVHLDSLVLDDNPSLTFVCPWFLRSAPNLSIVSLKNCPRLDVAAGMFADKRFFPALKGVVLSDTSLLCDCALLPRNESHVNDDLVRGFRQQLQRQRVCRHNGSLVSVDAFFDDAETCRRENELVLSDRNPTLDLAWFDPYADPEDENSTLSANRTDLEVAVDDGGDGRVPVWTTVHLDCRSDNEAESIFWVTPTNAVFLLRNKTIEQDSCQPTVQILNTACGLVSLFDNNDGSNVRIFDNGTLRISDFGYSDRGLYECFVSTGRNRAGSAKIDLGLDPGYRNDIYNLSLIYGFAVCGAFLLLTLLFKLIHFLLHNYGCCLFCCCCENKLPPKARRLKRALDSIEAYRSQQLDKLRENYTQQSDWIRQNCASQMERVRDNYNTQIQNLKDIRQYGSTQLGAVRGQYYEQMSRIRDYSANQLDRVYENYIFQRQRLRKFSAQNYLRVQETGIYTRRTLTKVMENIPLYLDLTTCRQGLGERQTSLEWTVPDQLLELEPFPNPIHRAFLQREQSEHRSDSIYFTPTGTPVREVFGPWAGPGQSSSLKSTPAKEINPYKAVYSATGNSLGRKPIDAVAGHRRNKSWSQFLPPLPTWLSATNREPSRMNEVEVVIEHETTGDDYYIDVDVSPTASKNSDAAADTLTQSSRQSLRRCASVPSTTRRRSLASSSGIGSMGSGNTPQQQQLLLPQRHYSEEEVPLLVQQNANLAKSMTYLFPDGDPSHQKRLSI